MPNLDLCIQVTERCLQRCGREHVLVLSEKWGAQAQQGVSHLRHERSSTQHIYNYAPPQIIKSFILSPPVSEQEDDGGVKQL